MADKTTTFSLPQPQRAATPLDIPQTPRTQLIKSHLKQQNFDLMNFHMGLQVFLQESLENMFNRLALKLQPHNLILMSITWVLYYMNKLSLKMNMWNKNFPAKTIQIFQWWKETWVFIVYPCFFHHWKIWMVIAGTFLYHMFILRLRLFM